MSSARRASSAGAGVLTGPVGSTHPRPGDTGSVVFICVDLRASAANSSSVSVCGSILRLRGSCPFPFRESDRMFVQLTREFLGKPAGERIDVAEADADHLVRQGLAEPI